MLTLNLTSVNTVKIGEEFFVDLRARAPVSISIAQLTVSFNWDKKFVEFVGAGMFKDSIESDDLAIASDQWVISMPMNSADGELKWWMVGALGAHWDETGIDFVTTGSGASLTNLEQRLTADDIGKSVLWTGRLDHEPGTVLEIISISPLVMNETESMRTRVYNGPNIDSDPVILMRFKFRGIGMGDGTIRFDDPCKYFVPNEFSSHLAVSGDPVTVSIGISSSPEDTITTLQTALALVIERVPATEENRELIEYVTSLLEIE